MQRAILGGNFSLEKINMTIVRPFGEIAKRTVKWIFNKETLDGELLVDRLYVELSITYCD